MDPRRDRIPTLGPRAQANRPKFRRCVKRVGYAQNGRKPIEVRRVVLSEVPTLHDGPAHNTRSVSRVTDISRTESTDSAQPKSSASDHPTSTLGATSTPVIPRRSERLSQPPERYSPGIFFTDAGEPTSYEKASAAADSATWHLAMESENALHPRQQDLGSGRLTEESTCSSLQMGL